MNKYLLIFNFLFSFNVIHLCQSDDKYYFFNSHPINLLPQDVPLFENKVFLWADTTNMEGSTIHVLLINNTENELKFNGYQLARIQAEYKNNSNDWFRFVPFFYGWCGTAFIDEIKIPSNEFYVFKESFRAGNVISEIRFTYFGNGIMSSNSFIASIDTSEVELTKYDDIAYMFCEVNYLVNIIEEIPKPYTGIPISQKYLHIHKKDSLFIKIFNDGVILRAMDELVKRFPDRIINVLGPIAENNNHPYSDSAYRIVNSMGNNNK